MSGDPFRALHLKPSETSAVCKKILKRWGQGDGLPIQDNTANRERVRKLIARLEPGDALYRPDARLAAVMVEQPNPEEWPLQARLHAVDVLADLPQPFPFTTLYRLYQHFFAQTSLREAVRRSFASVSGDKPFSFRHADAVLSEDPVSSLMVHAFRGPLAIAAIYEQFLLQSSAPLAIEVAKNCYRTALANPLGVLERPWLIAHSAKEVLAALQSQLKTDKERGAFLAAIVRAHGALEWNFLRVTEHGVLPALFERITKMDMFGNPDERPHLWDIDREVVALVRRWLRFKMIGVFFNRVDAEPARRIFWQRATALIDDIHEYYPCNAFAMKIKDLWFVEFGETGNACYPYQDKQYQALRRWWNTMSPQRKENSSSLKDKEEIFLPSQSVFWDGEREYNATGGTLTHAPRWYSGSDGWHRKFEAYIHTFCHVNLEQTETP